jgi:uncharacterized membrane protein
MLYLALLLIGITAGLRAATPLAAVSVAAFLGWIDLSGTWAAFAGHIVTVVILVLAALGEFVGDQLPRTPSRKLPQPFTFRVLSGALAGVVLGLSANSWIAGLVLGAIGAALGTLGGYEARRRLAAAFGRDLPAALLEDAVALMLALAAVWLA